MTKEQKFYKALQDVFIGARIEGKGGFVNLMRIKSNYYRKIENILKKDIEDALEKYPKFRDELFDKLYSFFSRYFTESGSIYFNSTPFHNNIYEKVYTDEKDVILFWKTQMLYYVKTDRIFRSLPIEFPSERGVDAKGGRGVLKFYFDASKIESKKANEKRSLVFELDKVRDDGTIVFGVQYSERGRKTKQDEILKAIKRKGISITEEQLERAFRIFRKQSEVDFFINKNAKAFLQEQFKLWSYQYFWEGAKEWGADRVNQLQILKDIAFKIIDFISQFEDELVKIWNKPKFVKDSHFVVTLDRLNNFDLVKKIIKHKGIKEQIKEWQELGIVDEGFKVEDVFENSPSMKGWQAKPDGVVRWNELPFNPELKERAKELRKAGNLSEVLLWNQIKNRQFLGLDFDRQKIIGNYIVDFYCKNLGVVVEVDGITHDGKIEYDKKRDDYLKSLELKVIHILDSEVKKNIQGVMKFLEQELKHHVLPSAVHPSTRGEHPVPSGHPSIRGEFKHLPIDTKYFKDLELEILSQFEDLDKSLDGWLIKSENYQALNTILPKFKEKVQTIYIDPPFNTGDDFIFIDNFQDSSWLTLMDNRIEKSRDLLSNEGNFYLHLDHIAEHYGKILLDKNFKEENFRAKITWNTGENISGFKSQALNWIRQADFIHYYTKTDKNIFQKAYEIIGKEKKDIGWLDILGKNKKELYIEKWKNGKFVQKKVHFKVKAKGTIWNDIYSFQYSEPRITESLSFASNQKPENLLRRIIQTSSDPDGLVLDYFAGSGTTCAVAQKLNRRWIGIEMGDHFNEIYLDVVKIKKRTGQEENDECEEEMVEENNPAIVEVLSETKSEKTVLIKKIGALGRMKIVLGGDKEFKAIHSPIIRKPHLTKDVNWQGGGFFKYYELEQYEEALANCKYKESDLFNSPSKTPYQEYVFMKDEKMLKALEIDYKNNKVKVDLSKLYPNIDIAETLSNLTGKWVKKIETDKVWLEGMKKSVDTKNLDYKLIKPLIWWE